MVCEFGGQKLERNIKMAYGFGSSWRADPFCGIAEGIVDVVCGYFCQIFCKMFCGIFCGLDR